MEENTIYDGFSSNDLMIKWLWEILKEYDESNKAKFLFFITGAKI
jgi:hypothetical protein